MPSSVDSTRTAFLVPSSNTSAPHLFPPPLPPPPRTPKHKKALRPLSNSRHSLCKGPPLPINQKQSNAHASSTDPLTEGDDLSSAEKQSKLNPPHRLADMSQKRESLFFASFVRPSRPVQSTHQREAVGGWGGGSPCTPVHCSENIWAARRWASYHVMYAQTRIRSTKQRTCYYSVVLRDASSSPHRRPIPTQRTWTCRFTPPRAPDWTRDPAGGARCRARAPA